MRNYNPEAILVMAPTGRDAELIQEFLIKENIEAEIYQNAADLFERLKSDAGAILFAEEALTYQSITYINDSLNRQEPWSDIPVVVMTSGGETTHASLRVFNAFAPSGNVSLIERPFRPITLITTLQVALRARRRQYQVRELMQAQIEATKVREEFISIASHELKTPLTTLKLQTQINRRMIKNGNPDAFTPAKVIKLVENTEKQINRLSRLIEDMLDLSRVNTGKLTIEKTKVNLSELVLDAIEQASSLFKDAGCTLKVDIQPKIEGIWDRYRIEQVIHNLLTNAVRYAPKSEVSVKVSSTHGKAHLMVKDGGDGIPLADQPRIFERFERAVSSRNISGLGLGLYICREIIQSHHGEIYVESKPKEGATFFVDLPLEAPY